MTAPADFISRPSLPRTVVGGLLGGFTLALGTVVTFVLLGSGLDHRGVLFDPLTQSGKLIAVWTDIEPLPLFVTAPHVILAGYLLLGFGHALLYRSVVRAWPSTTLSRVWRLAIVIWVFSFVVFEFLGPFNLLGEPLMLVGLELAFWAAAVAGEAVVIVIVLTSPRVYGTASGGHPPAVA